MFPHSMAPLPSETRPHPAVPSPDTSSSRAPIVPLEIASMPDALRVASPDTARFRQTVPSKTMTFPVASLASVTSFRLPRLDWASLLITHLSVSASHV